MRRDLKVNAGQDSEEEREGTWPFVEPEDLRTVGRSRERSFPDTEGTERSYPPASYGTCFYFGPAGERCDRPAGESGFCREHAGNIEGKPSAKPGKIIAAIMAILALLWPLLGDVVQFIMRWIRQRHGF